MGAFAVFMLLVVARAEGCVLHEGDFEVARRISDDPYVQLNFVRREDSPLASLLASEDDKYALAEEAERAGDELRTIVNLPKSEEYPEAEA